MEETLKNLGPLAALVGIWEGDKGDDVAPSDDERTIAAVSKFRERIVFEEIRPVDNHEQWLYGLRYSTTATRIGETNSFHEELGYWLWDPADRQVMKCFIIPRGMAVNAGGTVEPNAKQFLLSAKVGDPVYGICSNRFLDKEFKTLRFDLKVTLLNENSFSYEEDTQLQLKGQSAIFHHTDKNTLKRIQNSGR